MPKLTTADKSLLTEKGISEKDLRTQFQRYKTGFPYLKIADSARIGDGIVALDKLALHNAVLRWRRYLAEEGDAVKFTPASGAASRMFKSIHAFVNGETDNLWRYLDIAELIANITRLPFYEQLNETCKQLYGVDAETLRNDGRNRELLRALVGKEGLNYGNMPKGLLLFHSYPFGKRTPLEEQLVEASKYVNVHGKARVFFTVSEEHMDMFNSMLNRVKSLLEQVTGTTFSVSLSVQKPSTDTVAARMDGTPYRENDVLVFRPGGHGSLIENLNDIDASVIFIKNIDNVAPEWHAKDSIKYKEVLGGVLVSIRDAIHGFVSLLTADEVDDEIVEEAVSYLRDVLCIEDERLDTLKGKELIDFIVSKLDRPLRVCGMVPNEGEPGGGPFLVYCKDGSISPQILESTQIDPINRDYIRMVANATHFNPVDIVCYVRDASGKKYDLRKYVDEETGFIAEKSVHGTPVLAMERPGLWNGAMSDWNTVFVQVPISTFNPVKTVNDLLRATHCVPAEK